MESADTNLSQRLVGQPIPAVRLLSTTGEIVDLTLISAGRTVIYCYPRTSEPSKPAPTNWDLMPGARGCTASLYLSRSLQGAEGSRDECFWHQYTIDRLSEGDVGATAFAIPRSE
jgi:hypothetical protein